MSEPEAPAGAEPACPPDPSPAVPKVCASCGFANEAGADLCARPGCRKMLARNALARRTGLHAANLTPELRAIEDAGRALAEQSIADAGGRSELAARELTDHEYRALLHVRILKLALALDTHGDFDWRGRLRKGWIELLDRLVSSAVSIDKTLGLSRKAKLLPSATEILAEYAARREAAEEPR